MKMTYENYLREQVNKGQYGVCIISAEIALDIANWIVEQRNKTTVIRCADCYWKGTKGCVISNPHTEDYAVRDTDYCSYGESVK